MCATEGRHSSDKSPVVMDGIVGAGRVKGIEPMVLPENGCLYLGGEKYWVEREGLEEGVGGLSLQPTSYCCSWPQALVTERDATRTGKTG